MLSRSRVEEAAMKKWIACVLPIGVAILSVESGHAQQAAPSGSADRGKQTFATVGCWQCHGYGGQGGQGTGPRVADDTYDMIIAQVRHPASEMPAYEPAVLPDQAVADIFA